MFKSSLIFEKLLDHMDNCKECQKLWDSIIDHYENRWKECPLICGSCENRHWPDEACPIFKTK